MKTTSVRLVSSIIAFVAMSSCATTPELASGRVTTKTDSAVVSRSQEEGRSPEIIAGNAGDPTESTNESRSKSLQMKTVRILRLGAERSCKLPAAAEEMRTRQTTA